MLFWWSNCSHPMGASLKSILEYQFNENRPTNMGWSRMTFATVSICSPPPVGFARRSHGGNPTSFTLCFPCVQPTDQLSTSRRAERADGGKQLQSAMTKDNAANGSEGEPGQAQRDFRTSWLGAQQCLAGHVRQVPLTTRRLCHAAASE